MFILLLWRANKTVARTVGPFETVQAADKFYQEHFVKDYNASHPYAITHSTVLTLDAP